jgi:glutamate dehydrogenase/leucine dehydrogenase
MVALLIEEVSDQGSVTDELLRISQRFQDHIGPIIAVEEWSSTEDMKTSSAVMRTWRDEIRPRWKVRTRVIGVVRHRQWVEIGVAGGGQLGR